MYGKQTIVERNARIIDLPEVEVRVNQGFLKISHKQTSPNGLRPTQTYLRERGDETISRLPSGVEQIEELSPEAFGEDLQKVGCSLEEIASDFFPFGESPISEDFTSDS